MTADGGELMGTEQALRTPRQFEVWTGRSSLTPRRVVAVDGDVIVYFSLDGGDDAPLQSTRVAMFVEANRWTAER